MNPSAAAFNDRIVALTPALRRIARATVGTLSEYDAEDLYQTIVLKMLERAAQDPAFAQKSDTELLTFAQWRARSKAGAGRIYTKYVEPEKFYHDDEGDEISFLELIPSNALDPEEAVIAAEGLTAIEDLIQSLDPANRKIIYLLYQGYNQVEIAAALNVTRSAVNQRKSAIGKYLSHALEETLL